MAQPQVSLEALLPKGIRVRKGKKSVSLIVQTRKQITQDGVKTTIPDCRTVRLDLPRMYTPKQYTDAFLVALEEAKKEKLLAQQHIATHGVETNNVRRVGAVATLKEVYDATFDERYKGTKNERNAVIYGEDIFAFFPKAISMHDLQTWDNYDNFITFMEKRIKERKMNNRGTYTTGPTNK